MTQVDKTKENLKQCQCIYCPSYSKGCKMHSMSGNIARMAEGLATQKHFEGMFCAFEKSDCIRVNKGCICTDCPIYHKYHLDKKSYCLHTHGK